MSYPTVYNSKNDWQYGQVDWGIVTDLNPPQATGFIIPVVSRVSSLALARSCA